MVHFFFFEGIQVFRGKQCGEYFSFISWTSLQLDVGGRQIAQDIAQR